MDDKMTKEQVLKEVKDKNVGMIRLWFFDIVGQVKSFAVSPRELENALENGMGFDGSSVTGYQDIEESDMIAMPDPSTFRVIPWRPKDAPVARMICDVMTPFGEAYEGDPRYVLKRAVKRANDMGYDHFYIGPELEYYLFKDEKTLEPLDQGSYFDLTDQDVISDIRRDTILGLEEMKIKVEYSHHEVGPSQHEIDIRYGDALDMADNVVTYRVIVKKIARRYGLYATFMPKPLFGQAGNGMHVHQSLFHGNVNAFFDANDPDNLSADARHYIAGQLHYAREMSAVLNQWVNSYKRLVPGYEAPCYIAWSLRNRSALIRVPVYHPGKEYATRLELRNPDPACNPYLSFAVMLHAGLDGIEQKMPLGPAMDKNLYHLTSRERADLGIKSIPDSLGRAIDLAENSDLLRRALGDHVFSRFIELKNKEWDNYRVQVTPYELNTLLPIL
jgi:glutamine synthetase